MKNIIEKYNTDNYVSAIKVNIEESENYDSYNIMIIKFDQDIKTLLSFLNKYKTKLIILQVKTNFDYDYLFKTIDRKNIILNKNNNIKDIYYIILPKSQ